MIEKNYPLEVAKGIAADTEKNMTTNIGRLKILEQFDELPLEYRSRLLQMLSAFHRPQIGRFYQMIQDEYGMEYHQDVERALKKLRMAGVKFSAPEWFRGTFHAAFCTPTRHMGALSVSIFWKITEDEYTAECFLLHFGMEGISHFVLMENISAAEQQQEEKLLQSLSRLTLRECQLLLTMSYACNQKTLVRPSLGHFLYKRLLLAEGDFSLEEAREITMRVSAPLYGKRLVNSLFLALKTEDEEYALSLFDWMQIPPESALRFFAPLKQPGTLFLEGNVESVAQEGNQAWVRGYLLLYTAQKIWKHSYDFRLYFHLQQARWMIEEVVEQPVVEQGFEQLSNPLQKPLYVRVFQILDMEVLLSALDSLEQVQKVGELPYGLHLRICTVDDAFFDQGVSLMSGVVADLVVSGEEFVVLADQESITMEFDSKFEDCVELKQAYEVSLNTAIHYYQGQYQYFEEVLELPEDHLPQDPMCFVTACYVLYQKKAFEDFVREKITLQFDMPQDRVLYYQLGQAQDFHSFEAEYLLDENYLTVSAFGEAQLECVRQALEEALPGCLSFEHLEVNPHGFFEILTPDVREALPQLEATMKEIYLSKWYVSCCPLLRGMSPKEAQQTEEGRQLLWRMFKFMRLKPFWFAAGKYAEVSIQEFVAWLEKENL